MRSNASHTRFLPWALAIAAATIALAAARRRRADAANPRAGARHVAALYDRGASRYDAAMAVLDRLLFGEGRRWVAARARGDVLEIAAGSGRTLPYYPSGTPLTLLDVSPAMLELARRRAQVLGIPVEVRVGDAQALELPDDRFDTVVCTLGLCTIPDERLAIAEAWRVLRAGGQLLLMEHVGSSQPLVRLAQHALDPVACLLARDHLLRDPLPSVRETGFIVEQVERHALGTVQYLAARKPRAAASL